MNKHENCESVITVKCYSAREWFCYSPFESVVFTAIDIASHGLVGLCLSTKTTNQDSDLLVLLSFVFRIFNLIRQFFVYIYPHTHFVVVLHTTQYFLLLLQKGIRVMPIWYI